MVEVLPIAFHATLFVGMVGTRVGPKPGSLLAEFVLETVGRANGRRAEHGVSRFLVSVLGHI